MSDGLKTRSIKGLLWSAFESVGVAVLSLGSFIILARILEPGDIGAVALASAFIIIFNLIIAYGFVDAIVLQLRLTPEHLDTGFWSTLTTAVLLSLICTLGAETAATWLGEPKIATILPWLSTLLIINSLGAVPIAIFRRELRFRTLAICNVSGRAIGAVASVAMAFAGFGLWSLIGQQLIAGIISSIAVVVAARWRPRFRFSLQYLREMGEFGFHVSTSQVISALGEQTMNLLVGTLFGTVILGHFSVAWRMVQLVRALISSAVYQVAFSTFAKLQHDRPALVRAFTRATKMSCLIGFPIGAGMAVTAEPTIHVLFGAKWEDSIPLIGILALDMLPAFYLMFFSAGYRALGRPAWALYSALLYFTIGMTGIVLMSRFGIVAVTIFWVCKSVSLMPIHLYVMHRFLGISLREMLGMAGPALAATATMAGSVAAVLWFMRDGYSMPMQLAAAVVTGMLTYVAAARLFAPALVRDVISTGRIMITPSSSRG